jgi:hypothetical protein
VSTETHLFDLTLEEIPVTLKKPNDPVPWDCVLREMDGAVRDAFLNGQKGKVRMQTREVTDFKDLHTSLIARCLYDKGTGKLVEAEIIRGFPAKVQSKLYDLCVRLNGLSEKAETELKND